MCNKQRHQLSHCKVFVFQSIWSLSVINIVAFFNLENTPFFIQQFMQSIPNYLNKGLEPCELYKSSSSLRKLQTSSNVTIFLLSNFHFSLMNSRAFYFKATFATLLLHRIRYNHNFCFQSVL